MINLLKIVSSITLIVGLIFLNIQLEYEKPTKSNLYSGSNMKVEAVDAATCKTSLGDVCERWSEWETDACNVVEGNEIDAYPCEE
jgi:hypothetical protein